MWQNKTINRNKKKNEAISYNFEQVFLMEVCENAKNEFRDRKSTITVYIYSEY